VKAKTRPSKYIGHNVYNRISFKLNKKRVRNPREMWIRHENAFEAIVDEQDFEAAQALILERRRRLTDEEVLARLRDLLQARGRLGSLLIDEADGMPSSAAFRHRFGTLVRAYELVGYRPNRDVEFVEINRRLRRLHPEIVSHVSQSFERRGGRVVRDPKMNVLVINGMLSVAIVVVRCRQTETGLLRWRIQLDSAPDLTIAVRMDPPNRAPLDYYVLPSLDLRAAAVRIKEDNGIYLDGYRFDSLEYFFGMAENVRVEVAA
jgi:hypothetical protein